MQKSELEKENKEKIKENILGGKNKDDKNMDEKEVKKQAFISVSVVLLYCICILVTYHRIIGSM